MKLEQIKLYNFRQFYQENILDFSIDSEKNVTLVHGENGVGKTTLLNAIMWCFFEKLTDDFESPNELVCNQAIKEGVYKCRVEIRLLHEEKEYLVLRSYDGRKTIFKIHEIIDYNHKEIPNPKSLMNSILPKDMAGYFFFHGEGATTLSSKKSGSKFRKSIRDILGFTFAEKAIEDLESLKSKQTKKISQLQGISKKTERAINEKNKLEERIRNKKDGLVILEEKLLEAKREANLYDDKIRNSNHLVAIEKKRTLTQLEFDFKRLNSDLKRNLQNKQSLIQKYGWAIFGYKLANKGLDFIDEESLKGRIPSPYDETLVNDLIERKSCICGRALLENTEPYKNVKGLLETANTAIITQKLSKARSFAEKTKGQAKQFIDDIDSIEKQLTEIHKAIGVNTQRQAELEEELENLKDGDRVKTWQGLSKQAKQARDKFNQNIGSTNREISTLDQEIRALNNDIFRGDGAPLAVGRIESYQNMIDEMISRCKQKLEDYESSSKRHIASSVNEILKQFSRKDYEVRLSSDYEFHLVRDDGKRVAKSKGENLLLNLSFISALINHANERSSASGEFLVSGTVAPFVIDAPFGELDETYKAATASFLPKNTDQLILFLSSSHWKGTVDHAIREKVGKEYILVSERMGKQGAKPDDEITINDTSYLQSIYSQNKDCTTIKEVS
jgi:DNA sulfur modification protein DndD